VSAPIRVLLADDQPLLRSGFSLILSTEEDIEVVGQAADGREAVEEVARLRPDVVLMDVQMPVLDGIEATRAVVSQHDAKVLILTTFDRDDYLFDALDAGASGFLLKNADPDDLVEAVRAVAHGHALLAPEVTRRVISRMTGGAASPDVAGERHTDPDVQDRLGRLTDREREVLTLVARGLSNSEIATELFLGEATVKTHVSSVLSKLHLRDRVQAVVFAYAAGLAPSSG
jgi:DNA-binding NarL/FixJ family response regulator